MRTHIEPGTVGAVATRIAIDGPVGAGKTTVGRLVAQRLGYRFLDTGVMYRALTRMALDSGVQTGDEPALAALACAGRIEYRFGPGGDVTVEIDGKDQTPRLRTGDIDRTVSTVAALPSVREILVSLQREIAGEAPIVMVGRDIGTVVLAEADLKIYLTASVEERARRRFEENSRLGIGGSFDEILEAMRARDRRDTGRAASPLKPAEGSLFVDSDHKTIREVVDEVLRLAEPQP